jgi:hypothetical protein
MNRTFSFLSSFTIAVVLLSSALLASPGQAESVGYARAAVAEKMAVTSAGYDDIGDVLNQLGLSAEEIQESDLSNLEKLKQYDVVYINCSSGLDSYVAEAASVINQYVKEGGVVYASDYADYLIKNAFPGKINFYGSTTDSSGYSTARIGSSGSVTAKVVDSGLSAVLGKTNAEINFDLGSWAVIDSVGSGTKVHITGPVSIYDYGSSGYSQEYLDALSNLDYSNPQAVEEFYQNYQSGNTGSSSSNVQDKPYVVSFSEGEGEVLYTSFHNEAQKTSDMEKLVNWFAVRTRASRLARATQSLATSGDNVVLQEVVDTINQGDTKTYYFNATGKADFKVILNFGGSTIDIKITDPKGSEVSKESVSSPPYTKSVSAKEGKYTVTLTGAEIPSSNYPFILSVSGAQAAAADPIYESTSTSGNTTTLEQGIKDKVISFLKKAALYAGIGFVGIIALIVLIIVLIKRGHRKKNSTQPPAAPPAAPPATPAAK